MNIFAISPSAVECAQALDDKRVIKMCTETAQIFCTANASRPIIRPYKPTHSNHPIVKWAKHNPENSTWCLELIEALGNEYRHRFGKTHETHRKMSPLIRAFPLFFEVMSSPKTFQNCAANSELGLDFRNNPNVFEAYQQYLSARWDLARIKPKWTNRSKPSWYSPRPLETTEQ